jgi:hypothetical protein
LKMPTGRAAPSADRERHDENYTVTTGCRSDRDVGIAGIFASGRGFERA